MMRHWSFFDLQTLKFVGRVYSSKNDRDLYRNTPQGCGSIEGRYDPLAQCVGHNDGVFTVVERHDAGGVAAAAARGAALEARGRIADLERRQMRAIREGMLHPNERDSDGKLPRERLQAIDEEIKYLRASISAETGTSAP